MFGAIVLRDIPKEEVRIDLVRQAIQGGFRGFTQVPPAIWHYVSIKDGEKRPGFWCYLEPQDVVVKVYQDGGFVDADPDTQAQFSRLALHGAMGPALLAYPMAQLGPWLGLVDHLPHAGFPPPLHAEEQGSDSRFDRALLGTHGGNAADFLAEFQYAFVAWLVSQDRAAPDPAALARWRHLVLATYNAGEDRMREHPGLFSHLAGTLLQQLALLPDDWFGADSFVACRQADYLAEDMIDSEIPELVDKGRALAAYFEKRRHPTAT